MNIEKENESPREAPRDGAERNQREEVSMFRE